jgi:hypothetical protein
MAVNWILPVRAVQAVLSITVLGLMSYGSSPSTPPHHLTHTNTSNSSTMVVNTLAPILPHRSKLPHLRALLDRPRLSRPRRRPIEILSHALIQGRPDRTTCS